MAQHQKRHSSPVESKQVEPDASQPPKDKRTDFLTARQLAELLQVSESTIHRLRRTGRIPAVVLTNRLIRFNLRDVRSALRPIADRAGDASQIRSEPSPQLSFEDLSAEFIE